MNYKIIVKFLAVIVGIVAAAMILPWLWAVRAHTKDSHALLWSLIICATVAALLFYRTKSTRMSDMGTREASACVTFAWIAASAAGALPYLMYGCCAGFTDAFFETMSGFSTTGSTIFKSVEQLPKGILLWRSTTQWLGGMGIVVLALAITPILGGGANGLFKAESPGPVLQKTDPTINLMSKNLWNIYVGVTLLCVVLLMLGGMPLFDSLCHALSAVSTGGFSVKNDGIGAYNSAYIEYALTFVMFICGISFTLHLAALAKRSLKPYRDSETFFYVKLVAFATASIAFFLLTAGGCKSGAAAFKDSLFNVVSLITTTGFANAADFSYWPPFAVVLVFLLMFPGGCAGSTSGGIKCVRINSVWQAAKAEIKKIVHPNAIIPIHAGEQTISEKFAASAAIFIVLYLFVFLCASLLLCAAGNSALTSLSAVAATLGNIGPGLREIGPKGSFAQLNAFSKWVCSFCMLCGRLELYTVFVLFRKDEWVR